MVFASRRTWVDPDEVERILQEDGYRKLNRKAFAIEIGDVAVYQVQGRPSHVGIVASAGIVTSDCEDQPVKILSKWGEYGEFIHEANEVPPLFGRVVDYWTDRR